MRKLRIFLIAVLAFVLISPGVGAQIAEYSNPVIEPDSALTVDLYTPVDTTPLNVKEAMTLSPMFTPDNALDIHAAWLSKANTTIELQNQYIKQFDRNVEWADDPNPVVKELVAAAARGVNVRVQVRDDSDSDDVATYLDQFTNLEVRFMGSSTTTPDDSYLSATHNKLVIIDSKVTLVSSINFGDNAFLNNREAGMVVQSVTVSEYFLKFFDEDWEDGETLVAPALELDASSISYDQGESFTDIPRTNFTGTYNVSAYVNPDNADRHIFKYLESAKESIYVSMYTISREDFVDALVELKQNNPALDIQVLISRRRVGASENVDTQASALRLVDNLIPVYNSTSELNFYHNKYWIIDQKHTFIYSGNWSPRSVTPVEEDNSYSSGDPNRDMGIAVHDATDIADWVKTEVWDKDVAVATAYDLPVGITQNSFSEAEVVSGEVDIVGTVSGLTGDVSYSFGSSTFTDVELTGDSFSVPFDTTTLDNGVAELTVKIVSTTGTFTDSVSVTVANLEEDVGWRVLLTEVLPNPDALSDTEGEFFELTNSFDFDFLLSGWSVGASGNNFYTFPEGTTIGALSSLVFSRDKAAFDDFYNVEADVEFDFSLTNGGDFIEFLDYNDFVLDSIAWGDEFATDGSESTGVADAGLSIQRSPLHIDTDTAADFVFATPDPHGTVPLPSTQGGDPTTSDGIPEELPAPFGVVILGLVTVVVRRRFS